MLNVQPAEKNRYPSVFRTGEGIIIATLPVT